jgi:S-adenosylmethionine/arginine decarboxylase-like enzyme
MPSSSASELVKMRTLEITGQFADPVATWQCFLEAINRVQGVTILATIKHDFPGGGMTGLVVLGESHAAIHTWPERGLAWVELATCGDPASLDDFSARMVLIGGATPTPALSDPAHGR